MLFRPPLRRPALHNVFSIFHESRREDSLRISRIFQFSFINQQSSWCVIRSKICGRDTLFNPFFPGFERNKFIEITLLAYLSRIFYSSRCCTRIHLTPFFFSSRFQDRYLLHLPFTGNIRIIYIEITRSRWEKLLKVNCGRREREREEESLKNLISLESRLFQVFHHSPPLIRFRSFKTSPRRGSIVQRDTQELDRTDPQRTELSLRAVRPLPLEFPRGPLGDPFLPRDFLALESFGGRYISRNCKKQRGNKEARGKSFGKRDGGGHFARLLFC